MKLSEYLWVLQSHQKEKCFINSSPVLAEAEW